MEASGLVQAHWRNFVYAHTARHWHAFWLRYAPDGTITSKFHAERVFSPLKDSEGCEMRVAYIYDDERGTVDTGPQCGPWRITKEEHSAHDGLQHPSSTMMTTLMLPGGPSAWCAKASPLGEGPCAAELFLHHGEHLRMSAGVVQATDGALKQLSLIREDARGPWPSGDWSSNASAKPTTASGLRSALALAGAPISAHGHGSSITARLRQSSLAGVAFEDTRIAATTDEDVILLCPDHVAIVAPARRVEGAPFSYAAAWWPPCSPSRLYTIEARWDAQGALQEVRHLEFVAPRADTVVNAFPFASRRGLAAAVSVTLAAAAVALFVATSKRA